MAQDEPDIDVIAVEVYRRGLAQLLCAIDSANVGNIRLIRGNGVDVLDSLIAPNSLSGVRAFFRIFAHGNPQPVALGKKLSLV